MFGQALVGIARIDTTGRFTILNDRFCEIVQRPQGELVRQRLEDIVDPEDRPQILDLLDDAIHTGNEFVTEVRYALPDGAIVWAKHSVSAIFDQDGAVRHLVAIVEDVSARRLAEAKLRRANDDLERTVDERTMALRNANDVLNTEIQQRNRVEAALKHDISERRAAQRALAESERRFRLLVQGVTDYALFMLDTKGCVTNWNTGAQRIHQYATDEIIGEHFSRFYPEEEQQRGEPARALRVASYEGKAPCRGLAGAMADDVEVVGVAGDYDELVSGAGAAAPQVIVTDIRMPPNFSSEGIDAAREVRKLHPGTGVVILSQFDEPEYAVSLLADGAAGCAYLLKDRVAEGDQLVRAIREVTTGGSVLDPRIVEAMMQPVTQGGGLSSGEEELLRMVAEGRTIKAIAAAQKTTAAAVSEAVERLFLKLAQEASAGTKGALDRLKMLHRAIIDGKEQGESLSRLLPGGSPRRCARAASISARPSGWW